MPDPRLLSPEEVAMIHADWDEWTENTIHIPPKSVIEGMDALLLAASLLPRMAEALRAWDNVVGRYFGSTFRAKAITALAEYDRATTAPCPTYPEAPDAR